MSAKEDKFPRHVLDAAKAIGLDYSMFKTVGQESNYSCLLPWQIEQVNKAMTENCDVKSISLVIDATAHIGCDTINLGNVFSRSGVYAIENNAATYKVLCQNLTRLSTRFAPLHGDCRSIVPYLLKNSDSKSVFIYFDPPWNGKEYKNNTKLDLFLSDTNVVDFISSILSKEITICLKTPYNYNFDGLSTKIGKLSNIKISPIHKYRNGVAAGIDYYLVFLKLA